MEALSEYQEAFFHREDYQALVRVARGCCGVFIPGDTQKLSGCGPGQLALDGPA